VTNAAGLDRLGADGSAGIGWLCTNGPQARRAGEPFFMLASLVVGVDDGRFLPESVHSKKGPLD
jgi:hypothetical protein